MLDEIRKLFEYDSIVVSKTRLIVNNYATKQPIIAIRELNNPASGWDSIYVPNFLQRKNIGSRLIACSVPNYLLRCHICCPHCNYFR